ncbi:MAG: hypothetical protein KDC67_06415 [Ignavibacteriae bacterium]|nr:hypothetical protein [Ignavibacteriota bacterium]
MNKVTETIRGYKIKSRKGLSHWDALLEEWMLCIERYTRVRYGDQPYAYNERANIGLLAAAAWRCGRTAIEETRAIKGYFNKPKWTGRIDLWIGDDKEEELIESKFKWLPINSPKDADLIISLTMKEALADAKKSAGIYKNDGVRSLGIGFFPVYLKSRHKNKINEMILKSVNEAQLYPYHAIAWCFPKEARNEITEQKNLLPGIIMVINNTKYS